jgi:hypothetical protein
MPLIQFASLPSRLFNSVLKWKRELLNSATVRFVWKFLSDRLRCVLKWYRCKNSALMRVAVRIAFDVKPSFPKGRVVSEELKGVAFR